MLLSCTIFVVLLPSPPSVRSIRAAAFRPCPNSSRQTRLTKRVPGPTRHLASPTSSSRPRRPVLEHVSPPWPAPTPVVSTGGDRALCISAVTVLWESSKRRFEFADSPTIYRSIKWKPFSLLIASVASSGLSYTTYAVPFVLSVASLPSRIWRMGPYRPNRSYRSFPVMLKLLHR